MRTSLGAFTTLNTCNVDYVYALATRGAANISVIIGAPIRVIATRLRTMCDSVPPSKIGANVLDAPTVISTITRFLHKRGKPTVIISPIVITAANTILLRGRTVRACGSVLVPRTSLVAPGVPRTRMLSKLRVGARGSVRGTTREVVRCNYHTILIGNKRQMRSTMSVLFSKGRFCHCRKGQVGAGGARNAKYALSTTLTIGLTRKGALAGTTTRTGTCLANTVRTTGSRAVKRKDNPIHRF